jgi:hypothetical protein
MKTVIVTLSPKMIFDDNNNNTEDDGSVFYEEDVQFAMATEECMKTGTVLANKKTMPTYICINIL